MIHFESRYWSIDTALAEIDIRYFGIFFRILFRGLNMCKDPMGFMSI